MKTPTPKQRRILSFINDFVEERGYPPSIRDILRGCQISSTSVVDYNLRILAKEGYLRRDAEVSRGIEVLSRHRERSHLVPVPIIGLIAAGEPIPVPTAETWNSIASAEFIELTQKLIGAKEGVYALKVKGTSMIDALINDGDIVLMQQVSTADDGEMVAVWLKSEKEATLKRVYREPGVIRLQPANSQMQPIYTDPDNIEIQGKVIAVIRRLT